MDGRPNTTAEAGARREPGRLAIVGTFVAFAFALAIAAMVWSPSASVMVRQAAPAMSDDDLTTGSIVFVPLLGDRCRKRLIDNATWRIRDNGFVDCRTALMRNAHSPRMHWYSSRIDVIRNGFRRTPDR